MKDRLTFFIWIVLLTLAWLPGKVDQATRSGYLAGIEGGK